MALEIFQNDEANHPLWFTIKNTNGEDTLAKMPFREKMLVVKKLLPDVSECKYIPKEKTILLKSLKKHREQFSKINLLGNIKVIIEEKTNLNIVKGTIFHNSLTETNDQELTNDLKQDNPNIVNAHIFTKFVDGRKMNTATAVVTFDCQKLPKQIKYLTYLILNTKQYYPNPTRCVNCYQYGHFHSTENPCKLQKICGQCSQPYHLANPTDLCDNNIKCCNCGGPHQAWSRNCPVYKEQCLYVEEMVNHRCSFFEAKKIVDSRDNRKQNTAEGNEPRKYNNVAATSPARVENTEIKDLQLKIANMTNKMEVMCNLIQTLIKDQRKYMIVSETPVPPSPITMDVGDTDSADEEESVQATPNQPTVLDMKNYYTADYTKGGNNNPPPQHQRSQKRNEKRLNSDKPKEKDNKKKK